MMTSLIISRMGGDILAGVLSKGKIGHANVRPGRLKPGHKDETTTPCTTTIRPHEILWKQ